MKQYKLNKDCIEVLKTMKTESIDVCVTDCPYVVFGSSGTKEHRKKWIKEGAEDVTKGIQTGKIFEHNDIIFSDWLPELFRVMKNGTHTYIMINGRNLSKLQFEAEICGNSEQEKEKLRNGKKCKKKGFLYQNLLVWKKGNLTPNKYYMQGAEFILMLRKGPAKNINNMGSSNIIDIPNIIGNKQHPTEKPVELFEYMLKNSITQPTEENPEPENWILDPFAGVMPIITAGKNLNCNTIAIEINEEYFNIGDKK